MFAQVAKRLLNMMGHSGTVPSALLAEDVPRALSNLEQRLEKERQVPKVTLKRSDDEADEEVSIQHRAIPLVNLLKMAAKEHRNVMWANA